MPMEASMPTTKLLPIANQQPTISAATGTTVAPTTTKYNKFLWKIFSTSGGCLQRLIDQQCPKKSNWMRNVRMATTRREQNLIACQVSWFFKEKFFFKKNSPIVKEKKFFF